MLQFTIFTKNFPPNLKNENTILTKLNIFCSILENKIQFQTDEKKVLSSSTGMKLSVTHKKVVFMWSNLTKIVHKLCNNIRKSSC